MRHKQRTGRLLLALGLLVACDRQERAQGAPARPAQAEPEHSDEPEHEELPTRVKLPDAVVRDAKLRVEPVSRAPLAVTLALPGEVTADPDRTAKVSSPIAGRIAELRFREGSAVKKGELLAVIAVADLGRLRAEQASALARASAARANAQRSKELLSQRLASEQTYLDARAGAEALEFEARAAGERLRALGLSGSEDKPSVLSLRAPLSGIVVMRNGVLGQPVSPDQVLCEIVDLSELWFLGRVFEKDLGRLQLDAQAEVQLNAFPRLRFSGRIEYVGRQVDPVARTVTARIRLENHDDLLRVGLFGTAYVSSGEAGARAPTLVVPRSALTEIGGKQVVFVRQADKDFELHEVTLGDSAAGKVQVLAGLREGEQVVVEGVFTLKSAVLKRTFAEEE
ncbi:MAG: Cobalt/zinc/cadmium efflux transporter, rane fusion protein CzcB family [Myxococcaceae bacterium]|nr:Cobalt/zinc/cadmium efflux transporter, rane fusion protein CzcB family [Myxococcaceae bacterium]